MEHIQDVMEGAAVLVEGIVVRRDAEPKKVNGLSNYVFVEIQDKVCGVSACTVHCHIRALRAIASRPDTGVVEQWECTDCALGKKQACTAPVDESQDYPPVFCPYGNGEDCKWELKKVANKEG